MIELSLIGIGTGNPDHVSLAAVKALNRADLVLLPRKGEHTSDLADLRRLLCTALLHDTGATRIVEFDLPRRRDQADYLAAVEQWHDAIARRWSELIGEHLPHGGRVALMIWGDPAVYDSSLRIAERLRRQAMPVRVTVEPGITSLQVLTAEHRIPLNTLAEPVLITTGRQLREHGWPKAMTSVAVMLDSGGAFEVLEKTGTRIWWGAYLGMDKQCLIAGDLAEVAAPILQRRAELRARHGWIMDTYLLRREPRKP